MRRDPFAARGRYLDLVNPVNKNHTLNDGRVAWWFSYPFGGLYGGLLFRDLLRLNDGTLIGGPTWQGSMGRPSGFGSIVLGGPSQYIPTKNINITTGMITIAAWVRPISGSTGDPQWIVNKNYDGTSVAYGLNLSNAGPGNGMTFFDGGWRSSGSITYVAALHNNWYYAIGIYDKATLSYYVNGNLDSSSSYAGAIPSNNANLTDIGRYANDGSYAQAWIDDVSIWNRPLTVAEVAAVYQQSKIGYPDLLNWFSTRKFFSVSAPPVTAQSPIAAFAAQANVFQGVF